MSLSRIIRSTFTQFSEEPVKEIQIRDMYMPSFHEEEEDEEEVTLSIDEILEERDRLLEEARSVIEREKKELEQQKIVQLEELTQLKSDWEQQKIELQQQAYEEGFSQGYEDGVHKVTAEMQSSLEIANRVVEDSKENARKYIEDQERVILGLGLTAAERIIGASLSQDEEIFLSIVKRGLKEAREMKEIKIYVSPVYHALVTKNRDELAEMFPTDVPFMIFVNEDLESTESYIETNHGRIVISIDEQLNELRLKLSEILDSKE